MVEYREIQVREDLCQAVENQLGEDSFEGLEPLLHFLLEELLRGDAMQMSDDEEQFIEQRLRELGYM